MKDGKLFAMFLNAGPRKNWNTHKMLEAARQGAEEAGAVTELVHLYDLDFKGCKSCFTCKVKNAKTNGLCAMRDDLRPVLERTRQADVVVLGSPVFFNFATGVYREFLERFAFPVGSYIYDENGNSKKFRDKAIETASIFTMNNPKETMEEWNYPTLLGDNTKMLEIIFGASETLYVCNTYQFADYSRYDMTLFSEEDKRAWRDAHFQADLQSARDLGVRLVERAKTHM